MARQEGQTDKKGHTVRPSVRRCGRLKIELFLLLLLLLSFQREQSRRSKGVFGSWFGRREGERERAGDALPLVSCVAPDGAERYCREEQEEIKAKILAGERGRGTERVNEWLAGWVKTSLPPAPSLPRFSCLLCIHCARVRVRVSPSSLPGSLPICGFLRDAFWTNFVRRESHFAK